MFTVINAAGQYTKITMGVYPQRGFGFATPGR
jgi:hypothetical protein